MHALDEATLATAAYMLGVMDRAFAMTLDYLKTRQQFGRLIGSFQALQHRAADLKIQLALTRASVESAAATLDGSSVTGDRAAPPSRAPRRGRRTPGCWSRASASSCHGGIGYTDEYDVGLYPAEGDGAVQPVRHRPRCTARASPPSRPEQDDE